jgi:hypothetical protein
MATNPWVSHSVRNEQDLYEDLVIESLKFYGQDVYYIPREIVNKDKVFLDDVPSRFSDAYKIEMYAENIEGFEGEGDLFSKFGVELRDQATFVVARRRWSKLIGDYLDDNKFRPREGDIIYLPLSESIFEIFKVETETPFYQLSNLPTFRLQCELFEYNDEDFDTGVANIDIVEKEAAFQYALTMDSSSSGYEVGEIITQSFDDYNMTGEITRWSDSDNIMWLAHAGATDGKYHVFTTTKQVVGGSSGAVATPTLVQELQRIQEVESNISQSTYFDNFEADFLDFSESNPFGDMQ